SLPGKPSKEHVLNLLGRLTEEPPPKPIPIPKGLRLTLEPQANVNRYDSLRRAHDAA
ncbi:IS21 family transposase, partial [Escherichia coli]|nr:IS21 family transposase [Escherichia coli]